MMQSQYTNMIHAAINRWDEIITEHPYSGWQLIVDITYRPENDSSWGGAGTLANAGLGNREGTMSQYSQLTRRIDESE